MLLKSTIVFFATLGYMCVPYQTVLSDTGFSFEKIPKIQKKKILGIIFSGKAPSFKYQNISKHSHRLPHFRQFL